MPASDHSAFSSPSPFAAVASPRRLRALFQLLAASLLALATACTPKIGDECTVSTNCSAQGDRLCDVTQPGGYCTIFNCEPSSCPEDSQCINFGTNLSPVSPSCSPSQGNSPYARSFCMATCGSNSDCRNGYQCTDLSGRVPNSLGAVLAEYSGSGMVCVALPVNGSNVSFAIPNPPTNDSTAVCTGATAPGGPNAGASSGGAANGSAGEAGDSGASGS